METKHIAGPPRRTMRVPWTSKAIFALAGFVLFRPGLVLKLGNRLVPRIPRHVSLGNLLFVAMLAFPIALVGLVPVLWIESRRGD